MRTFVRRQSQSQKEKSEGRSLSKTATSVLNHHSHSTLHLQRTIDHQALLQLVQAKPEGMGLDSSNKEVARFTHHFSQIPVYFKSPDSSQEKLSVSSPGDIYEQEADSVSEEVMRMPQPQAACACGGGCLRCQKEQPRQRHVRLQVKQVGASELKQSAVAPIVHDVLATPGQPLDEAARDFMEPRFGYDFSAVRVHTDAKAAASADRMNALAYTSGRHIVFGEGRYAPASSAGRRLLAHELAHVLQPTANTFIARLTGEGKEEEGEKATREDAATGSEQTSAASDDATEAEASPDTEAAPATPPATTEPALAQPGVTPGGHAVAPPGMASCPDAPPRTVVVLVCAEAPSTTPAAAEKVELPPPPTGRFGNDADRAKFAKDLAQCRAEREVTEEVEERYRSDVKGAKKRATEEAKADTEAALKAAVVGLDPKDRRAIKHAKAEAAADAKKAAARKIAAAKGAITRQDVATVTAELANKYEAWLALDFDNTMKAALARYGNSWLKTMQSRLDKARKRITKKKSKKPKVARGATPPPVKSAAEIAAEVEAEMAQVRCEQKRWVLDKMEEIIYGWAVGRREQVDFRTIHPKATVLKDFKPSYEVAEGEWAEIPAGLQKSVKARKGVAPELADFLDQLAADPATPAFTASNRAGHGGGSWSGKGFSTDIYLKAPKDSRGFWQHSTAVSFLLALDAKAKALGARWRVLYNDFRVAEEVNRTTGSRNVVFVGDSGSKLNWHGPAPLLLHFHLDLEIPRKSPDAESQP